MNSFFHRKAIKDQAARLGRTGSKTCVFLMTNSLETGGSERQFALLSRSLNRDIFDVELGCLKRTGAFLEGLDEIAEFHPGGSFFNLRAQRARLELARHLRAKAAAIVHSFDFYSNIMLIPTAKWARVPVVIGSQRQIGDRLTRLQSTAQAAVFRMCDRVVCNSLAAAERLSHQGLSKSRIIVIPNGLPPAAFEPSRAALPRQPGLVRIAYVARMNDLVKNHRGFLRAAARLASRFPSVEFVLVGDGPLRSGLEEMTTNLGLGARVRFLGERHDMAAILASVDISVLFSASESMSNAVLEGMAAGLPVVASRVGGNPEVIQDRATGLLVKQGDEKGLVEALATLVEQPDLRIEYGQRGKKLAQEKFRIEHITCQYEELYNSLLREKIGRTRQIHSRLFAASLSDRPLRVAIVAASPRWIGGQGVQANTLVSDWLNDPEVDVRFIPIDPIMPAWVRWVERIPLLRTFVRAPIYFAALWRGTKDVDVVHIFSASYSSFLIAPMPAWLIARILGKKTLFHYHSGEARDHLRRSAVARRVLRQADRVVVPSSYLASVFGEFGLQVQALSNVVDSSQFRYRPRHQLLPRLLCTRGFHPYYGVDVVVRAFGVLKKTSPESRLCLVGKGPSEKQIRDLVRTLGLADVEFTGPISHSEISTYYERNDIFINASWLDNMPVSILEAFASGTPVVTTAAEGIRYLVEHERTGLLCEPGDWRALAENVRRLLQNPQIALQLAINAYEESRRYQWEVLRAQWLDVYRSLSSQRDISGNAVSVGEKELQISKK